MNCTTFHSYPNNTKNTNTRNNFIAITLCKTNLHFSPCHVTVSIVKTVLLLLQELDPQSWLPHSEARVLSWLSVNYPLKLVIILNRIWSINKNLFQWNTFSLVFGTTTFHNLGPDVTLWYKTPQQWPCRPKEVLKAGPRSWRLTSPNMASFPSQS